MLTITLQQMRTGWARLLAAGLAIALGTGFVAATLLGGEAMRSAAYQSFTADYQGADVVLDGAPLGAEAIDRARGVAGAGEVHTKATIGGEFSFGARSGWGLIGAASGAPPLAEGAEPRPGEIALRTDLAERLGVEIGEDVDVLVTEWTGEEPTETTVGVRVSGLLPEEQSLFSFGADAVAADSELISGTFASTDGPLAITATGVSPEELAGALEAEFGAGFSVQTVTEVAEETTEMVAGQTHVFTAVLLGFAGVALAAAILVISNTFAVLVASRTRTLALLRTIGASRGQVGRAVTLEAVILGALSSFAGIALGYGVVAAALAFVTRSLPGIDIWQGFTLSPRVWAVTLATGMIVTLLASMLPARTATRVRPLAALRPEPVKLGTTAGRFRATIALLAFSAGAAMLVSGVWLATSAAPETSDALLLGGLALGVLGGFTSVVGILLGSVFIISPLVRAIGALFGRGATARVATLGALRNPRRTATTANALFIGVALVVLMGTGAATAKSSLTQELAEFFPIEVEARSVDGRALTPAQIAALAGTPGVEQYTALGSGEATVSAAQTADLGEVDGLVAAVQDSGAGAAAGPDTALSPGAVIPDPELLDGLADGEVLLPPWYTYDLTIEEGDEVVVTGEGGSQLRLRYAGPAPIENFLVTTATLSELFPEVPMSKVWMKLDPEAAPYTVVQDLEEALTALGAENPGAPAVQVGGGAVERAAYEEVIDTLLLVVTAMLAVAVLIALVGVANTLSLSVLERRRESATLRAIGLTSGQLRGTLAIEGVIIAVVGALIGIAGGVLYGWAGSATILGALGSVTFALPGGLIAAVSGVAVLAGLLASVLPARSATKVSPVAALAEE